MDDKPIKNRTYFHVFPKFSCGLHTPTTPSVNIHLHFERERNKKEEEKENQGETKTIKKNAGCMVSVHRVYR
jgi:hypothetical protein